MTEARCMISVRLPVPLAEKVYHLVELDERSLQYTLEKIIREYFELVPRIENLEAEFKHLKSGKFFVPCPDCDATGRMILPGRHSGPACELCGERCYVPATEKQIEQLERS